jgi:ribonuclease BN (tRNA processing enzyme)/UTP-glucose-1-phosphate uridylyltransferase
MSPKNAQLVQFAIIPAAGKGTRLLPATSAVPKELIPLGSKPMIHYAFERLINVGIPKVVVVLNPSKDSVRSYLIQEFSEKIELNFVIQKEPTGLADAISLCCDIVGKRPFILYMPDGFYWGDPDFLSRLLNLFNKTRKTSLGIYSITPEKACLYSNCGRIRGSFNSSGYLEIKSLGDKASGSFEVTDGTFSYRGTGVSICTGEFFDYIERYRLVHKVGELDDVPVFQMILKEKGLVGELFKGEYFDAGNQKGLMYVQHFLWEKAQERSEGTPAPFEMIVLGSGTAIPHKNRFGPGYALRINNRYLLFDPRAGTLHRAVKYGIGFEKVSHIFFTHLHPDHTGDLIPILFALKRTDIDPKIRIRIIGPPKFLDFYNRLKEIYGHWIDVPPERAEISDIPREGLINQQWSIMWETLFHTENSIGFRVTHKESGKVWVYSGDTDYCEGIVMLVNNADVAVLECSFPDRLKVTGHLTPSLAGRIAKEGNVKHLVLSHFYPQCNEEDVIELCRREFSGKITIATDYLRISI